MRVKIITRILKRLTRQGDRIEAQGMSYFAEIEAHKALTPEASGVLHLQHCARTQGRAESAERFTVAVAVTAAEQRRGERRGYIERSEICIGQFNDVVWNLSDANIANSRNEIAVNQLIMQPGA